MSEFDDPTEAYKQAKANQAARAEKEARAQQRANNFPDVAEKRMIELKSLLESKLPEGLRFDGKIGSGGLLGDDGVKGLFFFLYDGQDVVAQGAISCSKDEKIVWEGFPPEGDPRPKRKFGEKRFVDFSDNDATAFLCNLILTYIG